MPELRFLKTSGGIYHDCVVHNVSTFLSLYHILCTELGLVRTKIKVVEHTFLYSSNIHP